MQKVYACVADPSKKHFPLYIWFAATWDQEVNYTLVSMDTAVYRESHYGINH